jgi:hypothetical protein
MFLKENTHKANLLSSTVRKHRQFIIKREEVAGGWRRLHYEELHNEVYTSPNIIMMIKTRVMKWVEHVARMEYQNCIQYFGQKN